MNFKEIIKQEREKEFPNVEYSYEESLTFAISSLLTNICVWVWNSALELAAEEVDVEDYYETNVPDRNSILKFKIDEQGTDTTEVWYIS